METKTRARDHGDGNYGPGVKAVLLDFVGDNMIIQVGPVTVASVKDVNAPISHVGADKRDLQ